MKPGIKLAIDNAVASGKFDLETKSALLDYRVNPVFMQRVEEWYKELNPGKELPAETTADYDAIITAFLNWIFESKDRLIQLLLSILSIFQYKQTEIETTYGTQARITKG